MPEPLLAVDNISRHFGGLLAVDKVSFRSTRGKSQH